MATIVRKKYPATLLYTGGVRTYNSTGTASYINQSCADSSKERDEAVSWITGGGVLVTHTHLFVGMECPQVIWVTNSMGRYTLAKSNIMRAVARLVVVTNSNKVKTAAVQKHFTVETLDTL